MSLILIVDDMAILREPIATVLRLAGFDACTAGGGQEALLKLKPPNERPGLILLDLSMPGMDGLTVLRALRADPDPALARTPVIVLTALSDKRLVVEAARIGVSDYLLKTGFSSAMLVERVRKHIGGGSVLPSPAPGLTGGAAEPDGRPPPPRGAAAGAPVGSATAARGETGGLPRLMERDACVERARAALQGTGLSGVVAQVVAMAASPRTDIAQLAALISSDPMLSARVLQAANSAAYTSAKGVVTNIREAVRVVGCAAVRNAAATMGVFDAMPASSGDGFNPIRCWQHSFAVARLCEHLVGSTGENAGVAYLVGLCHDLGEVLFQTHFAAEFGQVLEAQQRSGLPRADLERQMLGMTHGELVVTILSALKLPEVIVAPIRQLHSASKEASLPLTRVLRMAEWYANGLLLASGPTGTVAPLTLEECRAAVGRLAPPSPPAAEFCAEVRSLTIMLARLSAKDAAKLSQPLFERRPARICLVRDGSLSAFDPLLAALQAMAHVEVVSGVPSTAEMRKCAGLVIADCSGRTIAARLSAPAPTVPALWLTGPDVEIATVGTALAGEESRWPISLAELAGFVSRCAAQPKPAAIATANRRSVA